MRRWIYAASDGVGNRIEFVITHQDLRESLFDHPTNRLKNRNLFRFAINQITHKDRLMTRWRNKVPAFAGVAELLHEGLEFIESPVNIANDIVG